MKYNEIRLTVHEKLNRYTRNVRPVVLSLNKGDRRLIIHEKLN